MSEPNPYAPPQHDEAGPASALSDDGAVTVTFTLTSADLASALAFNARKARWALPVLCAAVGFAAMPADLYLRIGAAAALGALGWFLWPALYRGNAGRSLANKSEAERTVRWRFAPEGVEVKTAGADSRLAWSTTHRVVEGPQGFLVFVSEVVLHVLPKRAFAREHVDALRVMFARYVVPRKKRSALVRMLVLWAVLIVMFLAIWQFLQTSR